MEQLSHNITQRHKAYIDQLLIEKIYSKIQSEVTDPTIHQAEADIVVLNNKNRIWLKKPADKQVSASLLLPSPGCHLENPDHQSMPPKNTHLHL